MNSPEHIKPENLPFPLEWIKASPGKVEAVMAQLSLKEQARMVMQLSGKDKQDLLLLTSNPKEVIQRLSAEEVYYTIKEIGEESALPMLALVSQEQLQYIFDLDWWLGDRFRPQKAVEWLRYLERCDEPQIRHWIRSGDFSLRVVFMQALLKVFKKDEMTASYEGVDGWTHFSPDGVYDIFFKAPETEKVLRDLLLVLRSEDETFFVDLMEAIIWSPVTPTVETAYQRRVTRTSERGIPEFEEAFEIYSKLDPEALKEEAPSEDFFIMEGEEKISPQYSLATTDPSTFFGLSLALLNDHRRIDVIRWEIVYLANKVMVADRRDPSLRETQQQVLRKAMGYINIGLELGAGGDTRKGVMLLQRTWMQSLFQTGYGRLIQLRWEAERLIEECGKFFPNLLPDSELDGLNSLLYLGQPSKGSFEDDPPPGELRFESLKDVEYVERVLRRMKFLVRLTKHCLDLNEQSLEELKHQFDCPKSKNDLEIVTLLTTALARHALFGEVSSQPLMEAAARSFLKVVFIPNVFPEEPKECREEVLRAFHEALLAVPMAWTEEDKEFLKGLLGQCADNLKDQFRRLDPQGSIDWKFTRGLLVKT